MIGVHGYEISQEFHILSESTDNICKEDENAGMINQQGLGRAEC